MGTLVADALLLGSDGVPYGLLSARASGPTPRYSRVTRHSTMAVIIASLFLLQSVHFSYATRTASRHPRRYAPLSVNREDLAAARSDSLGLSPSKARLTLELPSFFDNTSPSSEDFPSFVSLADEPSPRPSGLWGNLKQYVELGTSDDRLQRTHESEEAPEEPKSAGETAERPERRPVPEKKEEEEPAAATEVTPDVTSGEKKSGEEVAEKKVTKEPKKESSETYHLLAQAKLRETREDLAKKTAGTPEEYDETGDYPSLCGSWQTVPSSPHFPSDPSFTRFSTADASPLPGIPENSKDTLPFPTCQWLPNRGVHVSERRTYGFNPNVVDVERFEFLSNEGCLPQHLFRSYWRPTKAMRDSKSRAEELSLELSWATVNVQLDANAMVHSKHLEQPAARSGTPTDQEKACWEDADRLWVPPMKQLHLDLRDICTRPHGEIIYSQRVPPEFVISPQDIAVSHEVLARRLRRRLRRRLAALQNQKAAHDGTAVPAAERSGLHSDADDAIQNNSWTSAVEDKFVRRWKNYLSQQSRWTEQVCQWQLLRESCLVPPSWNNAHAARKPAKGEEKEQGQHSECYLPTVRHTLTREKGIDYLELPLFPYTDQADSVRLRKVGECNPHKKVGLYGEKGQEGQRRHSANEELASVSIVYKPVHPLTGKPEQEKETPEAESAVSIKKHEAVPTEKVEQMETLPEKGEQAPAEAAVPTLMPEERHEKKPSAAEEEHTSTTEEQGAAESEQTPGPEEPVSIEGTPASVAVGVQETSQEGSDADAGTPEAQQSEEGSSVGAGANAPAARETEGEAEQEEPSEQEPKEDAAGN